MEAFADIILGFGGSSEWFAQTLNADRNICAEPNTTYISRIFPQKEAI